MQYPHADAPNSATRVPGAPRLSRSPILGRSVAKGGRFVKGGVAKDRSRSPTSRDWRVADDESVVAGAPRRRDVPDSEIEKRASGYGVVFLSTTGRYTRVMSPMIRVSGTLAGDP